MHTFLPRSTGASLLLVLVLSAHGADEHREAHSFTLGEDRFASGATVTVSQPTSGDLIVAGRDVELNAPVKGDVVAAGRYVRVAVSGAQDAYVAGQEVTLAGAIERNARVAGGLVDLEGPARVHGNLSVAGREILIEGEVSGYVQAAGKKIMLNGPVGGDVQLTGEEIELGPQARIAGRLRYSSDDEIREDPAAQVAGGIERTQPPDSQAHEGGWFRWTWLIGLMLLSAVLVAVLPAFTRRAAETARSRPGMTLLIGVAALFVIPALLVVAALTVIGIPLALVLLFLYLTLLLVGFVLAGIAIGDTGLKRVQPGKYDARGWRVLFAAGAVALLVLLTYIPLVGRLIAALALLVGMGAIIAQLRTRDRPSPA